MTWMRQPHYYMGLYPYTYSVGLVAATAMAGRVADEGPDAVQRWLQVLKAGGTRKPLDLPQLASIDLSSPAPIRAAVAYVGSLVNELERAVAARSSTNFEACRCHHDGACDVRGAAAGWPALFLAGKAYHLYLVRGVEWARERGLQEAV